MFYQLSDFKPGNILNLKDREANLLFTKEELLRAAFTVGRKSYEHVFWDRYYSLKEIDFRIAMVEAYIVLNPRLLKISATFSLLDPSEKGGINYFLASVFTKLYSEKLFQTKFLMHLDVYKNNLYNDGGIKVDLINGQKRPDFVGYSSVGWIAAESKGRVDYDSNGLSTGLEQVKNLKKINNKTPIYKLVMMMYQQNENLNMMISDPEEHKEEPLTLKVELTNFVFDYYSNILLLFEEEVRKEETTFGNVTFIYKKIYCNKYIVGIAKDLFIQLNDCANFNSTQFENKLEEINMQTSQISYIGRDGIIFKEN